MQMPRPRIHAITHFSARLDKTDELGLLLMSLLEPTRREQGCIRFELQQNRESPNNFAVVSEWQDPEAVQIHALTTHMQGALRRLPDLLGAPIDLRFYRLLG
jgi:quinol monooxygenase YgiN